LVASNFQGGQYKKIVEKSLVEPCASLYKDEFRENFENVQKAHTTQVAWLICPYPAGPKEVNNLMIDDSASLLPAYLPGGEKWKIEIKAFKNGELYGGFNLYVILRNERTLLN
jgi:hypothetical protein